MAHVVALDTPRRRLEPERVGELAERRVRLPTIGEPADPLLLEGVVRVALGELGEMPLLAALRHEQVHRTLPPLLRERDECRRVRKRNGNDDLRGHRGRDRVVLPEERREHLGRCGALGSLEREMVAAHDRPVADAEDLHDRVALGDGRREDVEVVALVRVDLLAVEGPLDGLQPVAQLGRALESEGVRGDLHLATRIAGERLVAAFEEEDALLDRGAVLLLRGVPDAWRGASLEMKEEARTTARQRRRRDGLPPAVGVRDDRELAGAVRKELLQKVERLVDRLGVRERTEVPGGAVPERPRPEDAGEILSEGHLHIGIGLVVLEPDVVAGMVLLDEVRLEEERLRDAAGEDVLEPLGALDHPYKTHVQARAEVRTHTVAKDVGLADVDHPSPPVLEEVHPGLGRE